MYKEETFVMEVENIRPRIIKREKFIHEKEIRWRPEID